MDAYTEAHLFVAAVRLLTHKTGTHPAMDEICSILAMSMEKGLAVSRKLSAAGIVETLEDPFSVRIAVADHLKIEELPRETGHESGLTKELEQFMAKKQKEDKKIEAIQEELDKKKRSMFDSFEKKLKEEMKKTR